MILFVEDSPFSRSGRDVTLLNPTRNIRSPMNSNKTSSAYISFVKFCQSPTRFHLFIINLSKDLPKKQDHFLQLSQRRKLQAPWTSSISFNWSPQRTTTTSSTSTLVATRRCRIGPRSVPRAEQCLVSNAGKSPVIWSFPHQDHGKTWVFVWSEWENHQSMEVYGKCIYHWRSLWPATLIYRRVQLLLCVKYLTLRYL